MTGESPSTNDFKKDIEKIAQEFKENVKLEDRKFRLKTYKQVFVGADAVDYLINSGAASSRQDAVELGKALQQMNIFEHVFRDHGFEDEYLFYRMLGENERGALSIDGETGQKIQWSRFLGGQNVSKDSHSPWQPSFPKPDFGEISEKDIHVARQVWPMDSLNTELLDNVHPPEWNDPKANMVDGTSAYDLVVIGAGAGGLVTAAGAAGVGAKVALIEENLLGGDCLNVGCVPSKAIIHSANLAHTVKGDAKRLEAAGIFVDPNAVKVDFEKVMERVRKIRAQISHHDSAERFTNLGVEIYIGRGVFGSDRTVIVNGRTLHFKKAVIATGGYPTLIPMKGLKELHEKSFSDSDEAKPIVTTNETFFNMTKQPKRLAVIGAGVIGMELAQSMQRLGTDVTVFGRSGKVLPKEDEDMAAIVKEQMINDGVSFNLSVAEYKQIELNGKVLENGYPEMKMTIVAKGQESKEISYEFDAILVAAGRRPNVTGMDLELAKVEYDVKDGLIVNDKLQTTNPRVFGVGDCCSQFKFTHAADFMARTVIRNALFFGKGKMSDLLIPYATFTSPEIASVGLYGKDLEMLGVEYRVFEKHFKDNDRAICDDATEGFIRFRVDAKTDTILGCSVVGEGAGNMIGEITLAMESGTGMGRLGSVIHPYPTTSEVVNRSGDVFNKTKLTNTVKMLLRGIVKVQM